MRNTDGNTPIDVAVGDAALVLSGQYRKVRMFYANITSFDCGKTVNGLIAKMAFSKYSYTV